MGQHTCPGVEALDRVSVVPLIVGPLPTSRSDSTRELLHQRAQELAFLCARGGAIVALEADKSWVPSSSSPNDSGSPRARSSGRGDKGRDGAPAARAASVANLQRGKPSSSGEPSARVM